MAVKRAVALQPAGDRTRGTGAGKVWSIWSRAALPCSTIARLSCSVGAVSQEHRCQPLGSMMTCGRARLTGLKQRYGQVRPDLIQRLTHEVDEVMAQEVGPFLLHAAELVERAAGKGIKMVLQGSGTGSLLVLCAGDLTSRSIDG